MNKYLIKKWTKVVLTHLILLTMMLIVASPLLFAIIKSTQSMGEIFSYPPKLSFGSATFNNYKKALLDYNLARLMLNSCYIAIVITTLKIVFSILGAFAFVFFNFKYKKLLFWLILITLMLPIPVRIIPLFEFMKQLNWGDSFLALTVPFLASATGTFLFRQYFMSFPESIVEAAKVDGVGPLRFLFQILVPMSLNTIGALAVIELIYVWNQYLWPLIIITSNQKQVVQIGLKSLIGTGDQGTDWAVVMAGAVITLLPPLIVFILLQEQFMNGFALSENK
ncbi:carbohydrate ABC transporter membrane protein 2 (CUT1 family) [Orenia metallireducens]|jgi:sn-glycerol 3-phosphate transport system permease protein|uniref:Carbohydrate ABC transporter membrane protein 2, CUT1 family n=1 Tax=Orenia metallireducens TaxID=1413210 RepID=A0A285HGI0_9FIRM|nr:carbohydrate ABC transporter permease [Orenia metallireducens]PRX27763.1 carbohydrate ABC transporter membrane protein 2 (CUT1 family) [Orenia metallireducens]SNY33946.1 carbohydrate ABC transporter membrane protein 2, CUT1 family [Orenia metallireducens]